MKAAEQITMAAILGTAAFKAGIKCAPCLDRELLAMLAGRNVGETPAGEASSSKLMQVWTDSWSLANKAHQVESSTPTVDQESRTRPRVK